MGGIEYTKSIIDQKDAQGRITKQTFLPSQMQFEGPLAEQNALSELVYELICAGNSALIISDPQSGYRLRIPSQAFREVRAFSDPEKSASFVTLLSEELRQHEEATIILDHPSRKFDYLLQ